MRGFMLGFWCGGMAMLVTVIVILTQDRLRN